MSQPESPEVSPVVSTCSRSNDSSANDTPHASPEKESNTCLDPTASDGHVPVMTSSTGAQVSPDRTLLASSSLATSTTVTDTSSSSVTISNLETEQGLSTLSDRPQRSVKPKPQFVEQYGPTRLFDYQKAYDELALFISEVKTEMHPGPLSHARSKEHHSHLLSLNQALTNRMNALRYMQLSDCNEATYSILLSDSSSLSSDLISTILPNLDSNNTSDTTVELDVKSAVPAKMSDQVSSEKPATLSFKSTLSTSLMKPGELLESSKQVTNASRASSKSTGNSSKSASSASSRRRIKLSEAKALEVKQEAAQERDRLQLLKQQVQDQLEEERVKARVTQARLKAERDAEEVKLRVRRMEEEANQEIECQRRLREMQNKLAAIKAKEEQDERQTEINAALAAAAVLENSSRTDTDTVLSSLPKIDKVHDLYLNRIDQSDQQAAFDQLERNSTALKGLVKLNDSKPSQHTHSTEARHDLQNLFRQDGVREIKAEVHSMERQGEGHKAGAMRHSHQDHRTRPGEARYDKWKTSQPVSAPQTMSKYVEHLQVPAGSSMLRYEAPVFIPSSNSMLGQPPVLSQPEHASHNTSRPVQNQSAGYSNPVATDLQAIVKSLAEALAITRLPAPKPPVFKGDPLAFPSWIAAFKHLVSNDSIKPEDKMLILRDYIDGPAKQAVGDLYFELSESSYNSALEILQKRFGEDYTIAETLKEKLDNWPNVKDKDYSSLMNFADYLKQCEVMSRKIQGLAILNDPSQIKKLLQKLPVALAISWGSRVLAHQNATGKYPEFCTFVSFLQEKTDTLFNAHLKQNQKTQDSSSGKQSKEGKIFATSGSSDMALEGNSQAAPSQRKDAIQEKGIKCIFCQGTHHVLDCRKFDVIELDAKRSFIRKNSLCHRCLHANHFIKGCRVKYECKICKANHHSTLHDLIPPQRQSSSSGIPATGSQAYSLQEMTPGKNNSGSTYEQEQSQGEETEKKRIFKVCLSPPSSLSSLYLPVYVSTKSEPNNEVLVYAMLDTMSDTSFIEDQVADKLHLQEQETCLTVTTLNSDRQTIKCKAFSDLRVRAYDSFDYINVPNTYSHREICTEKSQIPTRDFVQSLSHLKHLAEFFQPPLDIPVGLLLGVNVSEAMRPLQVVSGEPGEPYAQETRLGWGVVGEAQRSQSPLDQKATPVELSQSASRPGTANPIRPTGGALPTPGAWICGARRVVSSVIHRCVPCARLRGKSANRKMAELSTEKNIDGERIKGDMRTRRCDFNFIPDSISHFGDARKPSIRKTREVIEGLLKEHGTRLTPVTLPTLSYEVAAIANNRPLSVDPLCDPSAPAPIAPNPLLAIKPEPVSPPPGSFQEGDLYSKCWRRVQIFAEQIWRRWRAKYLSTLQPRRKWLDKDCIREGVILTDERTVRPGGDGNLPPESRRSTPFVMASLDPSCPDGQLQAEDQRATTQSRCLLWTGRSTRLSHSLCIHQKNEMVHTRW